MKPIVLALVLGTFTACLPALPDDASYASEDPSEESGAELGGTAWCPAQMSVFPVVGAHNVGYDPSCNDNTCDVSCGGERANSDYGGASNDFHHGIDIFAHRGATLVAVAAGTVLYAKTDEVTGSRQVKIRDACGWNYYYGHLETFAVTGGDVVAAGQPIGTMGNSGTGGVHLHFNASPGAYADDIDPLGLLASATPTACTGEDAPAPPPVSDPRCGRLNPGESLATYEARTSCSGAFTVVMQGDGNLVLYPTANQGLGGAVWDAHVFGPGRMAVMQADGNLVVYPTGSSTAVWSTGTHGHPGAYLQIGDGVLSVRARDGAVLWAST